MVVVVVVVEVVVVVVVVVVVAAAAASKTFPLPYSYIVTANVATQTTVCCSKMPILGPGVKKIACHQQQLNILATNDSPLSIHDMSSKTASHSVSCHIEEMINHIPRKKFNVIGTQ